jgi:hypothetical protein
MCWLRASTSKRARAVQRRDVFGNRLQPLDGTFELVRLPDVILVGIRKVVGIDVGAAGQRQKVRRRTFFRAGVDRDAVIAPVRLVVLEDRMRVVVRTVVGRPDGPGRMRLRGNRVELLGQEVLTLHGAHEHCHLRHRRMRTVKQGLQRYERDDAPKLFPGGKQLFHRRMFRTDPPADRRLSRLFFCQIHGLLDSM